MHVLASVVSPILQNLGVYTACLACNSLSSFHGDQERRGRRYHSWFQRHWQYLKSEDHSADRGVVALLLAFTLQLRGSLHTLSYFLWCQWLLVVLVHVCFHCPRCALHGAWCCSVWRHYCQCRKVCVCFLQSLSRQDIAGLRCVVTHTHTHTHTRVHIYILNGFWTRTNGPPHHTGMLCCTHTGTRPSAGEHESLQCEVNSGGVTVTGGA